MHCFVLLCRERHPRCCVVANIRPETFRLEPHGRLENVFVEWDTVDIPVPDSAGIRFSMLEI